MCNSNTWCVILAGGYGKRLWPVSTATLPKQFLEVPLTGKTFLQTTYERLEGLIPPERTIVVTHRKFAATVRQMLPQLPEDNVLEEPYRRDTAPCIAFAACTILKRDPDAVMVVEPSDHIIFDTDRYRDIISAITENMHDDVLMTIGVTPTRPDTNYGYIQASTVPQEGRPVKVRTFTEKPDATLAEVFVQCGEFLWNSGIFVWKAATIVREFERLQPQMASLFRGWEGALDSDAAPDFLEKVYADAQKISIDYAVMERTDKAWVYPAGDMGWYDVGTWQSLYTLVQPKDRCGNASLTPFLASEGTDNLILSRHPDKLTALYGLKGYTVVDTDKVLMICPRDDRKLRELALNLAQDEYEKYR